MPYRVKLQNFEGPLDLLLFLIRKNEVDIYDIPIALITKQYLEYVEVLQLLDLEAASEFILLAATLIRIKAKMLLPRLEDEEEEEDDPRMELVQRLLEYKRFKDMTPFLADKESEIRNFFSRKYFDFELDEDEPENLEDSLNDVSLFHLMEVFKKVLEKVPQPTFHRVEVLSVNLDEQIEYVLKFLEQRNPILFADLMAELLDRIAIIVTLIAILELFKRNQLLIQQHVPFGEIWIQKK